MAAKRNACTDGKEVVTAQMMPSRMARQFKEKMGTNVGTAGNSDIFVCVAHSLSASGTTNAESVHGSANPGICVRGKRKKVLTT